MVLCYINQIKLGIPQSSMVCHLYGKSQIVPHITKILQNFRLNLVLLFFLHLQLVNPFYRRITAYLNVASLFFSFPKTSVYCCSVLVSFSYLYVLLILLGFDHDREDRRDNPKKGNTIYVHGHGVTEELLRKAFSTFGTIVNITMELDRK